MKIILNGEVINVLDSIRVVEITDTDYDALTDEQKSEAVLYLVQSTTEADSTYSAYFKGSQIAGGGSGSDTDISELKNTFLALDGSNSMTGNLDMNGNVLWIGEYVQSSGTKMKYGFRIHGQRIAACYQSISSEGEAGVISTGGGSIDVGNYGAVSSSSSLGVTEVVSWGTVRENFLSLKGFRNMLADLPMGGFKVVNVADPISKQDAATKKYVDDKFNYTTNEVIIGKFDGKTLYRKTIKRTAFANSYTSISSDIGSTSMLVNQYGYINDTRQPIPTTNLLCIMYNGVAHLYNKTTNNVPVTVTLEYTKE